ncbi:hypothetical protein ES703_13463 [subsurface metagenome]
MDTLYYITGGMVGTGYVFSLIRPFIYTFVQNKNLYKVLDLSEAPPVRKEKERKESYEKLGKVYFLVNAGGAVGKGPVV